MRTHRFDPLSFVLGVLVVALAAAGLAGPGALTGLDLRWAIPAVLVVVGLVMVATTVRRATDDRDHLDAEVPDAAAATSTDHGGGREDRRADGWDDTEVAGSR